MEGIASSSHHDLTPVSLAPSNRENKVLPPIFSVNPDKLDDGDLELGLSPSASVEDIPDRLRGGVDRVSNQFMKTLSSWTRYATEKGGAPPCKYELYLNSQCFSTGNVYSTMARAMELGNSAQVSTINEFWQMATPTISCWLENKRTPLLGKMKNALAKGPEIATEVFEAMDRGE
ncbi:hypothetical protein KPH14_012618 [Odynerus spinipes]|uniref:Uncharacterized protein n=1 Tax=Odynerus spinipes TaxID=1348599 RepID=A0AAD9RF19_9HYME|nr:hypothetical protein KPH14_012618 [Odynerus spinipes]